MIYLDNNATTRPSDAAVDAMVDCMKTRYTNAAAATAAVTGADVFRRNAAQALRRLLNAEGAECFVFTSGATEANNWVMGPIAAAHGLKRIILSTIEHPSVSEPALLASSRGFDVCNLSVTSSGIVNLDELASLLSDDVALVSIMMANNETGTIQPLQAIGHLVRELAPQAIYHTDATQAVGRIPINLQSELEEVDLLSFSAHKFHGPKGLGGLYLRSGTKIPPLLLGGEQENGLRSGTVNTPALAGTEVAIDEAANYNGFESCRLLRDSFENDLKRLIPRVVIHGYDAPRLPNTSCFSVRGFQGADLTLEMAINGIIVGFGSACSSGSLAPSRALTAMGADYDTAKAAIRISLSRYTTSNEMEKVLEFLAHSARNRLSR